MDRLITLLCTMILAFGIAYAWDRHPPVHYVLPWWTGHMHVGLPDSLASQRDDAVRAENLALQARQQCRAALDSQNAAIALLSQKSAAKLAAAEKAETNARAVAESLRQASDRLNAYKPKGDDLCQRFEDADREVVSQLP